LKWCAEESAKLDYEMQAINKDLEIAEILGMK
jgi:hypothetical protein